MSTSFPGSVQIFPVMKDINVSDAELVRQYQAAIANGDIEGAKAALKKIPDNQKKIITADYLNMINDTVQAVQQYFLSRYSPTYIVSKDIPAGQAIGDFWFQELE